MKGLSGCQLVTFEPVAVIGRISFLGSVSKWMPPATFHDDFSGIAFPWFVGHRVGVYHKHFAGVTPLKETALSKHILFKKVKDTI